MASTIKLKNLIVKRCISIDNTGIEIKAINIFDYSATKQRNLNGYRFEDKVSTRVPTYFRTNMRIYILRYGIGG